MRLSSSFLNTRFEAVAELAKLKAAKAGYSEEMLDEVTVKARNMVFAYQSCRARFA